MTVPLRGDQSPGPSDVNSSPLTPVSQNMAPITPTILSTLLRCRMDLDDPINMELLPPSSPCRGKETKQFLVEAFLSIPLRCGMDLDDPVNVDTPPPSHREGKETK